jgi:hypothetical protein
VQAQHRLQEVLRRYDADDPVHRAVESARDELLESVERVHAWI